MEEAESTFVRAERMTGGKVAMIFKRQNKKFATEYIKNIDKKIKEYFSMESTGRIRGTTEYAKITELNSPSTLAIDRNNEKITALFTTGDFPDPTKNNRPPNRSTRSTQMIYEESRENESSSKKINSAWNKKLIKKKQRRSKKKTGIYSPDQRRMSPPIPSKPSTPSNP